MKTKIIVLSLTLLCFAVSSFRSINQQQIDLKIDPQGFYVKVQIDNVPIYVEEVLLTINIGGQLWDQQWVNPYSEGWDYCSWHQEVYYGTISAKVEYSYQGCWEGYDYETAYFWPNNDADLLINSYTEVDCN